METRSYTVMDVTAAVRWEKRLLWLRAAFGSANHSQLHAPKHTCLPQVARCSAESCQILSPSHTAVLSRCGSERLDVVTS